MIPSQETYPQVECTASRVGLSIRAESVFTVESPPSGSRWIFFILNFLFHPAWEVYHEI